MDVFDFDSSVRSDLEDTADSINHYMQENSIDPTRLTEPGDNSSTETQDATTEEHLIQ